MPYKPTGKPNGRPPKDPAKRAKREAEFAAKVAGEKPSEEKPERKPFTRARRFFREQAERLTPAKAVQVYDSRGRPRREPSSQRRIA